MTSTVLLEASGSRWRDWKQFRISLSMDAIATEFEFTVSDHEQSGELFNQIGAGSPVKIFIDDQIVSEGFIDGHSVSIGGTGTHDVSISGRSLSADLVDCAAIHDTRVFKNKTAMQIITELVEPFGIPVELQSGITLEPITEFKFTLGDMVFDVIDRLAKIEGLVPLPAPRGIILSRVSTERSRQELTRFETATIDVQHAGLFSEYHVFGETNGYDGEGEDAAIVTAMESDELVKRYRPIIIQQENASTVSSCETHAKWAKTRAKAESAYMSCSVKGFKNDEDELWELNTRIWARSQSLGISQEMLINGLSFVQNIGGGTVTEFNLVNPSLYTPEPKRERNQKSKGADAAYFDL